MSRRKRTRTPATFPDRDPRPGPVNHAAIYATADSICDRCHEPMAADQGVPIVRWHGIWVHQTCTPGGDDE